MVSNIKQISSSMVNDGLIKALEELLIKAKSGELKSFIGTGLLNNLDTLSMLAYGDNNNIFRLLGGLSRLEFMLNVEIDNEDDYQ
jgi:hypothetical protein